MARRLQQVDGPAGPFVMCRGPAKHVLGVALERPSLGMACASICCAGCLFLFSLAQTQYSKRHTILPRGDILGDYKRTVSAAGHLYQDWALPILGKFYSQPGRTDEPTDHLETHTR